MGERGGGGKGGRLDAPPSHRSLIFKADVVESIGGGCVSASRAADSSALTISPV